MSNKMLELSEISQIARDVTRGYNPRSLPALEEISWAFPISGPDRVYYRRSGYLNRIPNIQEGNALYELMLFRNFDNVLRFLSEGKTPIMKGLLMSTLRIRAKNPIAHRASFVA